MVLFWWSNKKEVIRMRVPFPNVNSALAVNAHMYVCIGDGTHKEFIKCQSFKPKHINKRIAPIQRIEEDPDIHRNPFNKKTILDCDKSFYIEDVVFGKELLATKRKDVCEELFININKEIKHQDFLKEDVDIAPLISLNNKIKARA